MIHWKLSALSIALGSAATLGFVWLVRRPPNRLGAPLRVAPEEAARADALHNLDSLGSDGIEVNFVEASVEDEVEDDNAVDVREFDEEAVGEEHYDAVDPEDIGTEWLRRATDAPPSRPGSDEELSIETAADLAEEIPVGITDPEGNTELHPSRRRSGAPVDLSPNDDELARRHASETNGSGSRRG